MLDATVVSERWICRLAELSRDACWHSSEQAFVMQVLSARIIELAQVHRRLGYGGLYDLSRATVPMWYLRTDFVSDMLANGHRLRRLTIANDFIHWRVNITVDFEISGAYVVRVLW